MDRALDKFAQCLQGLAAEGKRLAPGAARVILRLSDSGDPESERVVAGEDSSYIVVRCLLPALKLQNYGAAKKSKDPRSLGIAFEALWEF